MHLTHLLKEILKLKKSIDVTFIGSLYMKSGFHINRVNLHIFC